MDYISWFKNIPPELTTVIIANLPFIELRGAIPFALFYGLSPVSAYFLSVIGNLVPVIFILILLKPFSRFLMKRSLLFNRFFNWLFIRTRTKHNEKIKRWGSLALILLVAIPLPMTGGWTGALVAFLFGFSFKRALGLITSGVLIAGFIVILASLGILKLI